MPTFAYPPTGPSITGDQMTISVFLKTPMVMLRTLRTLIQQRFIADMLLTGRPGAQGGAVAYQVSESIYPDRIAEAIAPGGDYPVTTLANGVTLVANVRKWGLDTVITDEAARRTNFDPLNRGLVKLVNGVVRQIDVIALAAIAAAGVDTFAVPGAWATSTRILRDIATADAQVLARNQGYHTDTIVMNDLKFATMFSDPTIINAMRRESGDNFIYQGAGNTASGTPDTGYSILGKRVLTTPNLPAGISCLLLDSTLLGGLADEVPLTTNLIPVPLNEETRIRAKRITVPIVQEPLSAVSISGV